MMRRAFFGMLALALWLAVFAGCGFAFYYAYANGGILATLGAAILVSALVIYPAYKPVPTMNYAMVTFLGIRTGKVLREGPHFVLPWLEKVRLFPANVASTKISAKLYSLDRLVVLAIGMVRWKINPKLLSTTYVENYDAIPDWLSSKVDHELQAVAGQYKGIDFIRHKESVINLVNCVLRMAMPPHLERRIPPESLLEFYRGNDVRGRVLSDLRLPEDYSATETECGIQVLGFTAIIGFTDATEKAMEMEGQTKLELAAHKLTADQELALMRDLKAEGLDPQQAVEAAEVVLNRSKRKIFSISGLEKFKIFGR